MLAHFDYSCMFYLFLMLSNVTYILNLYVYMENEFSVKPCFYSLLSSGSVGRQQEIDVLKTG